MIQIIAGRQGKGKTKHMLDMANEAMATAHGTVAYLDKSTKHMFELDRKIRLINVFEYPIQSVDYFLGFLCGIISQDHDLEVLFLDSLTKLAVVDLEDNASLELMINEIRAISERYGVRVVISISKDFEELPETARDQVILSL